MFHAFKTFARKSGLVLAATLSLGALLPRSASADFCTGKVSEVTVTVDGAVGYRSSGVKVDGGSKWVSICSLNTADAVARTRCENMLSLLMAAKLSGQELVTSANKCEAPDTAGLGIVYIKLQ